ncbi:patatin-like phospholipase family protein [Pseudomaricurvus alkylphenolicus]|uniref:patatin-like phospholipase family protein n=1 Tax=Pseudomaricurvus alkylphenolicus TaxID=1306991 RepID=UPI00141FBBBB|nr:patatin-like phospholipase family protein [Pseudomaricurvus alkylphenolicus]NIB44072.1 patatin-like phospholipase family protein [Pseudomaricurvus alkylphenolicus]
MKTEIVDTTCLVLGGGGVTGISWMTGVLCGLSDGGWRVKDVGRIIGTSAGATVGAQICSDQSMSALFQQQIEPGLQSIERMPSLNYLRLLFSLMPAIVTYRQPLEFRRRLGAMAAAARTPGLDERRSIVASRLSTLRWPDKELQLVAVDAKNGNEKCFNRSSGVSLLDAVMASCAVPGVWPVVPVQSSIYMDGGMRSACNADLAAGEDAVLVIAPIANIGLKRQVESLRQQGSRVVMIAPDKRSRQAIGLNPLNPERRIGAALAGKEQGLFEVSRLSGVV